MKANNDSNPHSLTKFLRKPLFNCKAIAKELCLVEQHLGLEDIRCPDCIHKHLLTAEALADEAVLLDMKSAQAPCLSSLSRTLSNLQARLFAQGGQGLRDPRAVYVVKEEARKHRKYLVNRWGAEWVTMKEAGQVPASHNNTDHNTTSATPGYSSAEGATPAATSSSEIMQH